MKQDSSRTPRSSSILIKLQDQDLGKWTFDKFENEIYIKKMLQKFKYLVYNPWQCFWPWIIRPCLSNCPQAVVRRKDGNKSHLKIILSSHHDINSFLTQLERFQKTRKLILEVAGSLHLIAHKRLEKTKNGICFMNTTNNIFY